MGAALAAPLKGRSSTADLAEALRTQSAATILHRLRHCSGEEVRAELERLDPAIMLRLTGPKGYQAKRFLVMREDVLPGAWRDFFRLHASELFADGLGADCVLQRVLHPECHRSGTRAPPQLPR